jgi:integrase/recombinase XerD
VERTKGRNIKPRLIHPFVYEKLKELQRGLPEAFVFINPKTQKHYSKTRLEDIFRKARNITGIDINLYAAGRHSVATNAALAGADMRAIRDYLGHADSRTTEIYTHLDVLIQKQIFEKCKVINPSMDRLQTVSGGKS